MRWGGGKRGLYLVPALSWIVLGIHIQVVVISTWWILDVLLIFVSEGPSINFQSSGKLNILDIIARSPLVVGAL
jgi:hypothetical protein